MKEKIVGHLGETDSYWKICPTHHTSLYSVDKDILDTKTVNVLAIGKGNKNWKLIFDCPNLEEVNPDQPNQEIIKAISEIRNLKRLRIKSFRSKDIEFIRTLFNLEELALEYGSGFFDLSPLQNLPKLKSLHLENLRGVSNFDGLQKIESLKYLHIDGTLDRKQPISNFNFLKDLPNLEILSLGNIINTSVFPAFLSIIKLHQLLEIRIPIQTLDTAEYAFLDIAQPHVKKGFENKPAWPLYINKDYTDEGYVFLLGKGEGKVKLSRLDASEKLEAYAKKYEEYKKESRKIIENYLQSQ